MTIIFRVPRFIDLPSFTLGYQFMLLLHMSWITSPTHGNTTVEGWWLDTPIVLAAVRLSFAKELYIICNATTRKLHRDESNEMIRN